MLATITFLGSVRCNACFFIEKEKTREQKEAELIPKVQEAVNYGLRVLDSAFEQLDMKAGNSDSEDEESNDRVEPILEPKVKRGLRAADYKENPLI